jgi:hypothetical protein
MLTVFGVSIVLYCLWMEILEVLWMESIFSISENCNYTCGSAIPVHNVLSYAQRTELSSSTGTSSCFCTKGDANNVRYIGKY